MAETSIAQTQTSRVLSTADGQRSQRLGLAVKSLARLAATMGEPLDAAGVRLRLMAEELLDLPEDSVQHAIAAWLRGDKSHLSSYQADHIRVGCFFPKPSELRDIAVFYLREKRQRERDRERIEQDERDERHRREHPDQYEDMSVIIKEFYQKRGMREASTLPANDDHFTDPKDRVMAALSRGMYAGKDYEPAIVIQVTAWRQKQERKSNARREDAAS